MCPPKEEAGSGIKGPVTRQMDGVRSGPGNVGVDPCRGRRALTPDAPKGLRFGQEGAQPPGVAPQALGFGEEAPSPCGGGAPKDGFGSHPAFHPGSGAGIWTSRAVSSPSANSSVGVRGTTAPGECLSPGTELFPGVGGGETCAVEPGPRWPLRSCSPHWLVSWTGVPIPERRSPGTPLVPLVSFSDSAC